MEFLTEAFSFDFKQTVVDFLRVAIAFALAVPIGWERLQSERNLGLRTFPIVAIGACGFVLITKQLSGSNAESEARIIAGLLAASVLSAAARFLKEGGNVRGLATAASIWVTGAIGAAVALGREEIALVLSLITFATLRLLSPIVRENNSENGKNESERR